MPSGDTDAAKKLKNPIGSSATRYSVAYLKTASSLIWNEAKGNARWLGAAGLAALLGPAVVRFLLSFSKQPTDVLAKIDAQVSADLGSNLLITVVVLVFVLLLLVVGGIVRAPLHLHRDEVIRAKRLTDELSDRDDQALKIEQDHAAEMALLQQTIEKLNARLSTQPLDPKHEEQLRSMIPRLGLPTASIQDGVLMDALRQHVPDDDVWGYRVELETNLVRHQKASGDYDEEVKRRVGDAGLTSCLGAIQEVLYERLSELRNHKNLLTPPGSSFRPSQGGSFSSGDISSPFLTTKPRQRQPNARF